MSSLLYTAQSHFDAARRAGEGWHGHSFLLRVRAAPTGLADPDDLAQRCAALVAPLDATLLDAALTATADPDLVATLRLRLLDAGLDPVEVALRSAPDRGAGERAQGRYVWRSFRFDAAHRLPYVPPGHPCGRMHGHGYRVVLEARDVDAVQLGEWWTPLHPRLHHACLNDWLDNPTSERIAAWVWAQLKPSHPALRRIHILETEHSGATFDGQRHTIWKAQRFEAATRIAAATDGRRHLHGHGYRLRLHVAAPLDEQLGWTVDYGDVKRAFAPVRAQLDHHQLDTIDGLEAGDAATLARWIADRTRSHLPELVRVDLDAHDGCGAIAWVER